MDKGSVIKDSKIPLCLIERVNDAQITDKLIILKVAKLKEIKKYKLNSIFKIKNKKGVIKTKGSPIVTQ